MERVTVCAAIVALFMAGPAAATGPYVHGRLTHPAYAEIAGRPGEIADIKTYAVAHGWAVVCDQRAGEQSTIRLRFPVGTSQKAIEGYLNEGWPPGRGSKVQMIYRGMSTSSPLCIRLP
jgi:hypothetical protein